MYNDYNTDYMLENYNDDSAYQLQLLEEANYILNEAKKDKMDAYAKYVARMQKKGKPPLSREEWEKQRKKKARAGIATAAALTAAAAGGAVYANQRSKKATGMGIVKKVNADIAAKNDKNISKTLAKHQKAITAGNEKKASVLGAKLDKQVDMFNKGKAAAAKAQLAKTVDNAKATIKNVLPFKEACDLALELSGVTNEFLIEELANDFAAGWMAQENEMAYDEACYYFSDEYLNEAMDYDFY